MKNIFYVFSIALLFAIPLSAMDLNLSDTGNFLEAVGTKSDFYNALRSNNFTKAEEAIQKIRTQDPQLANEFQAKLNEARGGSTNTLEYLKENASPTELMYLKRFKDAIDTKNFAAAEKTLKFFENMKNSNSANIPLDLDTKIAKMKTLLEQAKNQ